MSNGLTIRFDDHPTVQFTPDAWRQMWYLVDKVNGEVGWLGKVRRLSAHSFLIDELLLPPQDANGTTTEFQEDDMNEWMLKLQEERHPEMLNEVTAWLHSHGSMGLGRSGQDMTQWEKWRTRFAANGLPSLAGRANKSGDIEMELYIPESGIIVEGITPTVQVFDTREAWQDELDALIAERVRPKTYTPKTKALTTLTSSWGGHYGYRYIQDPLEDELFQQKGLIGHSERLRIAARYGVKHYNTLTTNAEKEDWSSLVDELVVLDGDKKHPRTAACIDELLGFYSDLLTKAGEDELISRELERTYGG